MRCKFATLRVRNLLFREIDQDRALCTGILQRRLQPRERPFIDDRRVVPAVDVREAVGKKGNDENPGPRPPPSSKKASFSIGKYFGETRLRSWASAFELSDILTIARLPAARIAASGQKLWVNGKL